MSHIKNNMNTSENISVTLKGNEYIFDRPDIRIIFISLYSIVFCCCFVGNLLVVLVVMLSRRLRSVTNFFLANLALADICVGVFCVFQNLSIYLITSWVFGDFMCKMYQFIHSLSYTASIFILVVISIERYFAIIHPITSKQIMTTGRLKWVMAGVWLTSALYSAPKFIWVQTITNDLGNNETETICIQHRKKYNSELFDIINFCFLYLAPLCIISILYTRIAVGLWRSSQGLELPRGNDKACIAAVSGAVANADQARGRCEKHDAQCAPATAAIAHTQISARLSSSRSRPVAATWKTKDGPARTFQQFSNQSLNVLRARRRVIRMLIVVVLTFAVCNLPFHARKMWQYWSPSYQGGSDFSSLFTPLTFLVTYFNSGINPILYAFLSRNFRRGMRELIFCNCRGSQKKERNLLGRGDAASLQRRSSTRSSRVPLSSVSHVTSSDTTTG